MQKLNHGEKIKGLRDERQIRDHKRLDLSFHDIEMFSEDLGVEVVRLSRGKAVGNIRGLLGTRSRLLHIKLPIEAAIRTELQHDKLHFTLPIENAAGWTLNGLKAEDTTIFFNYGVSETYTHAKERNSIAGSVPVNFFRSMLGLLSGKDGNDVRLPPRKLNLRIEVKKQLVQRLLALLDGTKSDARKTETHYTERVLTTEIAYLLAQAASFERCKQENNRNLREQPKCIVKNAVEYFDAHVPGTISIADICINLNLSAPTLIKAFSEMVGETPKRFFALRQLARVRAELLSGSGERSAVKRSSIKHGFFQAGHFSVFYKSVYGEKPSQTAKQTPRRL